MIINKKERLTNQKKIIIDYLRSAKTHPSAKEVFRAVRKKLPHLSLGTVYRILNRLKEKAEILEIPEKVRRYDGQTKTHGHFICQRCSKIFDVMIKSKDWQFTKIKKTKFGKAEKYIVYFYGLCRDCQKGQKTKNN